MGIHPVQRKTFCDEEFFLGIGVEDHSRQLSVNANDGHLSGYLHLSVHFLYVFARFEFALLETATGVSDVIAKSLLRIIISRQREPIAIHRTDVFQIEGIGESVLRQDENGISSRMRLTENRGQPAARIVDAEIDAAARHGIEDLA